MTRQRVFSSEGCADAMVSAGHAAEAENYIDNDIIRQQHEEIGRLREVISEYIAYCVPLDETTGDPILKGIRKRMCEALK